MIKQNLRRLFSVAEIILRKEHAHTLSDKVLLIYFNAMCVYVFITEDGLSLRVKVFQVEMPQSLTQS